MNHRDLQKTFMTLSLLEATALLFREIKGCDCGRSDCMLNTTVEMVTSIEKVKEAIITNAFSCEKELSDIQGILDEIAADLLRLIAQSLVVKKVKKSKSVMH